MQRSAGRGGCLPRTVGKPTLAAWMLSVQASKVIVWPLTLWSPFQQSLLFSAHASGRSWTHLQGDAMHTDFKLCRKKW